MTTYEQLRAKGYSEYSARAKVKEMLIELGYPEYMAENILKSEPECKGFESFKDMTYTQFKISQRDPGYQRFQAWQREPADCPFQG